jgi:hypothetical protein
MYQFLFCLLIYLKAKKQYEKGIGIIGFCSVSTVNRSDPGRTIVVVLELKDVSTIADEQFEYYVSS